MRGCQNTVFLSVRKRPGTDDVVEFLADSDGEVIRGLLAVLQHLFSGQLAADICAFDLKRFLVHAGLEPNLTTSRRTGLAEVIKRLLGFAAGLCTREGQSGRRDWGAG